MASVADDVDVRISNSVGQAVERAAAVVAGAVRDVAGIPCDGLHRTGLEVAGAACGDLPAGDGGLCHVAERGDRQPVSTNGSSDGRFVCGVVGDLRRAAAGLVGTRCALRSRHGRKGVVDQSGRGGAVGDPIIGISRLSTDSRQLVVSGNRISDMSVGFGRSDSADFASTVA